MTMSDTSDEARAVQFGIFQSKTEEERFIIGDELASFGRKVIESSILHEYPMIPESELKIEVFKRYYSMFFPPEKMVEIISDMRAFLNK